VLYRAGEKMLTKKVIDRINKINSILNEFGIPMTVRQVFYQFVSKNWVVNDKNGYRRVDYGINQGRKEGLINWNMIVDTSRPTYQLSTWDSLPSFLEDVKYSFRLDFWNKSKYNVEVWTEKDALSGVIKPITEKYRIKLVVVRGYDSLSNLSKAKNNYAQNRKESIILYIGDHDPSGLDIPRAISEELGNSVKISRIALNSDQVTNLPPQKVKPEDPRTHGYKKKTGFNECWEVDALPPDVLRENIENSIKQYVDFELERILIIEDEKRKELIEKLGGS